MIAQRILPLILTSSLLVPAMARADQPAEAQALYDEARDLMAQGRYADACPKFAESQKIDAGLGTQFHLADCLQHIGRTATAWALFRDVESQARGLGQEGRERVARDRAAALEPSLSKLTIATHEAGATPGLHIRRDGVEVGREQWDAPVPVDPGAHVVVVLAERKRPWQTNVEVPADGKVVTVDLPPLADVPDLSADTRPPVHSAAPVSVPPQPVTVPPQPATALGAAAPMPPSVPETPILEDPGRVQRSVGWCFAGVGVGGLAAGVYFASQWIDTQSLANYHCAGGTCDAVGSSAKNDAHIHAVRAVGTLSGGAAAFLIGAVLVGTAPSPRIVMSASRIQIEPVVGPAGGEVDLRGTW